MLRITTARKGSERTLLRLEGRLTADELAVLDECLASQPAGEAALDLSQLRWIDAAGLARLSDLIRAGALVTACSPYIDQLLTEGSR